MHASRRGQLAAPEVSVGVTQMVSSPNYPSKDFSGESSRNGGFWICLLKTLGALPTYPPPLHGADTGDELCRGIGRCHGRRRTVTARATRVWEKRIRISWPDRKRRWAEVLWLQGMSRVVPDQWQSTPGRAKLGRWIQVSYRFGVGLGAADRGKPPAGAQDGRR
jgi:hypothetical protein